MQSSAFHDAAMLVVVLLVLWGFALRRNPAAHKRIMILSTIAILDPGYGRVTGHFLHEPQSIVAWFFF
jgi:hypothetical protein